MKKFTALVLVTFLLTATLWVCAYADVEGGSAKLTDASGIAGQLAELTVYLENVPQAQSITIMAQADPALVPEGEQWQWLYSHADFWGTGVQDDGLSGTSHSGDRLDYSGPVAKLCYRLPVPAQGQEALEYTVSVNIRLFNDGVVVSTLQASAQVSVKVPVEEMTLSAERVVLDLNGSNACTLTAALVPANATAQIQWTCADPQVASVQDGVITGLKPGGTTVSARVGDIVKTCFVTVMCSHRLTGTAAVAPTCQSAGCNAYYTCSICQGVLREDQITQTTVEAEILKAVPCSGGSASCTQLAICQWCQRPYGQMLPHSYSDAWSTDETSHWHSCESCPAVDERIPHSFDWVVDRPATALETGLKHEACSCGSVRSQDTVIERLDHSHASIVRCDAVPATCEADGMEEHFYCSDCDGFYACVDGAVGEQVDSDTLRIPASGHSYGTDWNGTQEGHFQTCSCGAVTQTMPHEQQMQGTIQATASQEGYTGDVVCTVCDYEIEKGQVIPALEEDTEPAQPQWPEPGQNSKTLGIMLVLAPLIAVAAILFFVIRNRK